MTIGIGFKCVDGIVICADTQITVEGSHTFYAPKVWDYREPDDKWSVVFTYAGSVDLMDSFKDKLIRFLGDNEPATTLDLKDATEIVLNNMRSVAKRGLDMLGALCIPDKELRMIKTSDRLVSNAADYEYVGAGDSSLLRCLADIVCTTRGPHYNHTSEQAVKIGTYLIQKAKRYTADSCGGDTEIFVLHSHGHHDVQSGRTKEIERQIIDIEERLYPAVSLCFDMRISNSDVDQTWSTVLELIKNYRGATAVQSDQ